MLYPQYLLKLNATFRPLHFNFFKGLLPLQLLKRPLHFKRQFHFNFKNNRFT